VTRSHVQEGGSVQEPEEVSEARAVVKAWEQRFGHDSYVDCLDGGYKGYQARCWDCDWAGPEHLRGDEQMGTPESRAHKQQAKEDAAGHQIDTRKPTRHGWMHWDASACMEPVWCKRKHYQTPETAECAR
jgi:hypothetical protein